MEQRKRYGIATYGKNRFEVQDLRAGRRVCVADTTEQAQEIIDALSMYRRPSSDTAGSTSKTTETPAR